jgi:hypothetical protein
MIANTSYYFVVYSVAFHNTARKRFGHKDVIVLDWDSLFSEVRLLLLRIELSMAVEKGACINSIE